MSKNKKRLRDLAKKKDSSDEEDVDQDSSDSDPQISSAPQQEEAKDKDVGSSSGFDYHSQKKLKTSPKNSPKKIPSSLPSHNSNDKSAIPYGVRQFRMPEEMRANPKGGKYANNMPFLDTSLGNATQSSIGDSSFVSQNPQSANKQSVDHKMDS